MNEKQRTGEGKSQGRKGRVTTDEAVSFLAVFTRFSVIRVGYPWWSKSQTLKVNEKERWWQGYQDFFPLAIVSNLQKRSPSSLTMQQPKMKSEVLAHILRNKCLLLSTSLQQLPVNTLTRYPRRESSYISTTDVVIPNTKDSDYTWEAHLEARTLSLWYWLHDHRPSNPSFSSNLAALQDTKKTQKSHSSEVAQLSPSIISANPGTNDQRFVFSLKHSNQ